jgi:D-alanine-D-alanine ligase
MEVDAGTDPREVARRLGWPVMVKPALEGSSIGMSRADDAGSFHSAVSTAVASGGPVFAERWITGPEYTAALLQDRSLPLIAVETDRGFYDYEAKYLSDETRYRIPCGLDAEAERRVQALALEAFRVTGASGWGRVDLMVDDEGRPWLIEVNTVPGMTDHSLVPKAARAAGVGLGELVLRILDTAGLEKW